MKTLCYQLQEIFTTQVAGMSGGFKSHSKAFLTMLFCDSDDTAGLLLKLKSGIDLD